MKKEALKTIFVNFSGNCHNFSIEFLVDRKRFDKHKLSNKTITGSTFYMADLSYKPYGSQEWNADNLSWIYKKFYKLLKKEKYDELIKHCFNADDNYSAEYQSAFKQHLIDDKNDLLLLLKTLKTTYNIKHEKES